MSDPENYSQSSGAVVVLDALGTKGIWNKMDPQTILDHWKEFISSLFIELNMAKREHLVLTYNHFSDTIIMTITGDEDVRILNFFSSILTAIVDYGITKNIYLRGAISFGTIYKIKQIPGYLDSNNSEMIIGPAIDEAAQYHEKGNWIGVMATPSVNKILMDKSNRHRFVGTFCKYMIPMKEGSVEGWAVPLGPLRGNDLDSFLKMVESKLKEAKESCVIKKWQNTLNFIKHVNNLSNFK
jgi:hypothetical protein